MEGFQKPLRPKKTKEVRMARISYHEDGAVCSCGWVVRHLREKVVEDSIDRHLAKKHKGRGFRW